MIADMVEIDQKQQLPVTLPDPHENSLGSNFELERLGTGEGLAHLSALDEISSVLQHRSSHLDLDEELNLPAGHELGFPLDPVGQGLLNLGSSRHYSPIERLGLDISRLAAELDPNRLGEPVLNHMRASVGRSYAIDAPQEVAEALGATEVEVHVAKLPHSNGQDYLYKVTVVAQQEAEPGLNPLSGRTTVGSFVVDHRGQQPEADRSLQVAARNIRNDFDPQANNAELAYWLPKVMSA